MIRINAIQVKTGYSGVGVYSIKVIERLVKKIKRGIIYTGLNCFGSIPPGWEIKQVKIFDRDLIRWLWHHLIFPLRLNKNDVLYCPFSEAPVWFWGKLIITVHDLMPLSYPDKHSKKLKFYYNRILRKNLAKAYSIIVISETTKQDLLKFFPETGQEKIKVIYNGYEKKIFNTNTDISALKDFKKRFGLDKYILYVGRLSRIKNVMRLVKAFALIKDKTDYSLLVIGKDESGILTEADNFIKNSGMQNRVKFIERLEENEVQYAYKGARLFIQPSYSEGFGLPAVEAMACGIPCVLSDIEAFREVSADAAMLFNPDNEKELAEKIMILLNNENLYNSCREKGINRANDFDWDKTADEIRKIINNAAGS